MIARPGLGARLARLAARPAFQSWAARFPLTRGRVRREGEAIFDLVSGFVQSQALAALVDLRVLHLLEEAPARAADLAPRLDVPVERLAVLLNAGVAMGLVTLRRGRYGVSLRGAALCGVPGLEAMIAHHGILYRDLADPVAFLRGETDPDLARFWPYVLGSGGDASEAEARRYSRLMADSQRLVAEDTLAMVDLRGVECLMDVGGGSGVFLSHVARGPAPARLALFDLPQVLPGAEARLAALDPPARIELHGGNFRHDPLPRGADAISLVRVLYDHSDETVRMLLSKVHAALPPGGRVIVSEPMTGGARPHRAGDVYFAFYCMAMGTGAARPPGRIAALLSEAGFERVRRPRAPRPFVTSVVEATRPAGHPSE